MVAKNVTLPPPLVAILYFLVAHYSSIYSDFVFFFISEHCESLLFGLLLLTIAQKASAIPIHILEHTSANPAHTATSKMDELCSSLNERKIELNPTNMKEHVLIPLHKQARTRIEMVNSQMLSFVSTGTCTFFFFWW